MAARKEADESESILTDAWDYKGRPAVRSKTGGWTAAAMILGVELCERLTTLGIAVNLVTYITGTMHLGNAAAANTVTNFMGVSFLLCLFGGFVADTFIGRYLTIAIFAAVQASGVAILTISTMAPGLRPPERKQATAGQLSAMYLALYLTALGTGGLKSSVSGFGSDQFDENSQQEKQGMTRFFSWFFFFVSLGSLIAVTLLVYVQDHIGRQWGYGACAAAIIVGLGVFVAGTRRYRYKKLAGSPLTQIAAVVVAAWRKRGLPLPENASTLHNAGEGEDFAEEKNGRESRQKQMLPHTKQFRFLDHAAIRPSPTANPSKWQLSTVTDVEEVKIVARMIPIWATTIMFWTVYAQMATFSVSQATAMNRRLGPSFDIPPGSITVFFVASILVTVPVYDRIVVPVSRSLTDNPQGLTPLRRIGVGLFLSVLAMAAAASIEAGRSGAAGRSETLSVFWLVPQFFLVGAGEAFTYIGQLDFFLRECPAGMKTMSTGLFLSTLSLGFFLSSALVTLVHRVTGERGRGAWLADDLNEGRLYDFYWLLAALCTANFGAYLLAAKWYTYKEGRAATAAEDESVMGTELKEAEACYGA